MFGLRGLTFGLKQAAHMSGVGKTFSMASVPKFNYSTSVVGAAMMQSLINPNTMTMLNLRELILKSKAETECVPESTENMLNLLLLN